MMLLIKGVVDKNVAKEQRVDFLVCYYVYRF